MKFSPNICKAVRHGSYSSTKPWLRLTAGFFDLLIWPLGKTRLSLNNN